MGLWEMFLRKVVGSGEVPGDLLMGTSNHIRLSLKGLRGLFIGLIRLLETLANGGGSDRSLEGLDKAAAG